MMADQTVPLLPAKRAVPDDGVEESDSKKLDRFRPTKLYDRQIRLWGWEAQQRLMKSRLLMYGLNGVGAEVLKNVMLGGIRFITVLDPEPASSADLTTNFFLRQQDIGTSRALASAQRATLLNPTCTLDARGWDSSKITADFLKDFDLVVLNGVSLGEAVRIGDICRISRIPVFASYVFGFSAFYLCDLNELEFEIPPLGVTKPKSNSTSSNGPSTSRIIDDDGPSTSKGKSEDLLTWQNNAETLDKTQTLVAHTAALRDSLTKEALRRSGLASPFPKRTQGVRRIDPYLNVELILSFAQKHGRLPSFKTREEDESELQTILGAIRSANDTRVVDLSELLVLEANFTCAIFGGTLAQEAIIALTRRGYPIYNFYYLAASDAVGYREYIH